MQFTTKIPSESGYYWILINNKKEIVKIEKFKDDWCVYRAGCEENYSDLFKDDSVLWGEKITC